MHDITRAQEMALLWMFVGICLVLVITRFAVRTWKHMWKFWVSEVWLALSVATFTIVVSGEEYTWRHNLRDWVDKSNVGYNKWKFFLTFIVDVGYYFPRFSLLAFYYELFPISEERLRKCLYFTVAYTTCAFLMDVFLLTFWCGLPVSKNWSTNDNDCALYLVSEIFNISWPIGLSSEILIFALPFGMLRRLKATPKRDKIALLALFSVGTLTIIMTTLRFVFTQQSIFTYYTTVISSAEIVSQILVCALPALRPLLPVMSVGWTKLASVVTGTTISQSEEDERTLRGSNGTRGMSEKDSSQMYQGNLAELGEWNPEEGNTSQGTDDRKS